MHCIETTHQCSVWYVISRLLLSCQLFTFFPLFLFSASFLLVYHNFPFSSIACTMPMITFEKSLKNVCTGFRLRLNLVKFSAFLKHVLSCYSNRKMVNRSSETARQPRRRSRRFHGLSHAITSTDLTVLW